MTGAQAAMSHAVECEKQILALKQRNRELLAALSALDELCDHVPVFQLDGGKSSVKAVRLAGKFMAARDAAKAVIAKGKA